MVGQSIGKYRVVDRIGKGGMGTVYRALDEMLHRDVAIKVLNAELNDPEVAKRFRAEAITVARLSHPGIATIYELFEYQGEWLMVMEFVRGETLENMVARMGPLSPQRSAELCMQALAALAHAHSMGVVHRDLKPANLMITENGTVKVMDFGIARVSGSEHLTNAGFMMGTPAYMAPEQVRGGDVDARADLYAMGVVFYRLATAKLPFKGETAFAMVQSQVNEPPTPVGLVRAGMPSWVEEIVLRALAKPVEERFQSAAEFHEAFARCLAGLPISSMYAVGETSLTPSRMHSGAFPMRAPSASFPMPTGSVPTMPQPTNPSMSVPVLDTDRTMMSGSGQVQQFSGQQAQYGSGPVQQGSGPVQQTSGQFQQTSGQVPQISGQVPQVQASAKKPLPVLWIGVAAVAVVAIGIAAVMFSGGGQGATTPTPTPTPTAEATPTVTPDPLATGAPTGPATTGTVAGTQPARGATPGSAGAPGTSPTPSPTSSARGATPTPSPTSTPAVPGADALVTFADVKMVEVSGKRGVDKDIVLNFGGGQIMIMPKSGGAAVATLAYKRITRATYVRARDPKWDAKLASPPDGFNVGSFIRTAQHWLVLQGADHFEIMQLKDSNARGILDAIEARLGIKVDKPSGDK